MKFKDYLAFLLESLQSFEKIRVLSKRTLMARYRRNALGVLWSFLNPMVTTLVLWFIFVQIFAARFEINVSYAQYVLSGILFTNLIQTTLIQIGESITSTGSLVTKVYLNPLTMVFSVALSGIMNFVFGLVPLFLYTSISSRRIQWEIIYCLPWLIIIFFFLCSFGIWIAIIYSKFYDLNNVISVGLMLINYITPIFYPIDMLHGVTRKIVEINPLTVLLDVYRSFSINYSTVSFWQVIATIVVVVSNFALSTYLLFLRWPQMVKRI